MYNCCIWNRTINTHQVKFVALTLLSMAPTKFQLHLHILFYTLKHLYIPNVWFFLGNIYIFLLNVYMMVLVRMWVLLGHRSSKTFLAVQIHPYEPISPATAWICCSSWFWQVWIHYYGSLYGDFGSYLLYLENPVMKGVDFFVSESLTQICDGSWTLWTWGIFIFADILLILGPLKCICQIPMLHLCRDPYRSNPTWWILMDPKWFRCILTDPDGS